MGRERAGDLEVGVFDLGHGEELLSGPDSLIRVERFTGERHDGQEPWSGPHVQRDPAIDQRHERVVAFVVLFPSPPGAKMTGTS